MSCPTCDHTMQRLGCQLDECRGTFWCPRCGTLLVKSGIISTAEDETAAPDLVRRCKEFEARIDPGEQAGIAWKRIGISESINLPGSRGPQ